MHDIRLRANLNAPYKDKKPPLKQRFEEYDARNPHVYRSFSRFTFELINAGHTKRLGAKLIVERMRWETMVRGDGEFKLSNDYTSFYARKFMKINPKYDGLFKTKKSAADE